MGKLINTVERLMKNYPYGSQADKESKDVMISAKLFDSGSSINWRLSEYDPASKVAFGYVTGFYEDEWGSVSLEELEELMLPINIENLGNIGTIPRIEVAKLFKPTKFGELAFNQKRHSD